MMKIQKLTPRMGALPIVQECPCNACFESVSLFLVTNCCSFEQAYLKGLQACLHLFYLLHHLFVSILHNVESQPLESEIYLEVKVGRLCVHVAIVNDRNEET